MLRVGDCRPIGRVVYDLDTLLRILAAGDGSRDLVSA